MTEEITLDAVARMGRAFATRPEAEVFLANIKEESAA
jgi:hypothetical protein